VRGRWSAVLRGTERVLDALALAGFAAMFLAAGAQVLFRYVLHWSVPWTEELARLLFVATVLLGVALATGRREHIAVDFLLVRLGHRGRCAATLVFNVCIVAFLAYLATGAALMAYGTWGSYFVMLPWMRTGYLYLLELLMALLMILYVALHSVDTVFQARGRERA
jgi:TRAP-type transport system small permease protein